MWRPPKVLTPYEREGDLVAGNYRNNVDYQCWRPRGTNDYLMIYTVGGAGRMGSPDKSEDDFLVEAGSVTLFHPNAYHDYSVIKEADCWHVMWAHFDPRPQLVDALDWPQVRSHLRSLHVPPGELRDELEAALLEMNRFFRGTFRMSIPMALNAMERAIFLLDEVNPRSEHAALDTRVRRAMERMCDDFGHPLDLPELAKGAGLSESRFSHLFKEQVGISPQKYLEAQRLRRAEELLAQTNLPIQEVAEQVGFESAYYFSLRFRKFKGESPSGYRKQRLVETVEAFRKADHSSLPSKISSESV